MRIFPRQFHDIHLLQLVVHTWHLKKKRQQISAVQNFISSQKKIIPEEEKRIKWHLETHAPSEPIQRAASERGIYVAICLFLSFAVVYYNYTVSFWEMLLMFGLLFECFQRTRFGIFTQESYWRATFFFFSPSGQHGGWLVVSISARAWAQSFNVVSFLTY